MKSQTLPISLLLITACYVHGDEVKTLHSFERQRLTGTYFSEGTNVGDFNRDGVTDVVYGPYWFEGPGFKTKHEIYKPVPQNTEGYANNFFAWSCDFNGDGWDDVLAVGFPGTAAYVYENPKGLTKGHWKKHEIFDWVSNESPQWTNLVGDPRPELVCTRDGFFGYVAPDWDKPFEKWTFHRISGKVAHERFGHGLGVGDINGDGRLDLLAQNGWYEQPMKLGGVWRFRAVDFAPRGPADIHVYDVDGDGDSDVITSLDAHGFGLAWYEQTQNGNEIEFTQHPIMGEKASDNAYGVVFTELHSVALADIDGDGLKDICTGKTYYSHHRQAPMWDAGAVVYWFKLVRNEDGVRWIPYEMDNEAGVGRQLIVADVNADSIPDVVSGGMKGSHVLRQKRSQVSEAVWQKAQPVALKTMAAGLATEEAAKQMTVPPGFQVQLAAGEPLIHQPIAFTYDHRGRLWVAEAYTYPKRAPDGEGQDKIVILEDTNQDGKLDSRKEFATGLNLVSGLEVGFGGVWVGAAPYLLFIPDENGDDIPDSEPKVLLDGFGYQDTHEVLNAFIWGPDGWLYGCHGVFTHSRVGKPGTPNDQRVPLNAGVWRYHPTRHEFDVFARGTSNPWGVDFNDEGEAFITACVIPHLWHVIQGARYQRQGGQHFNPYLYDDIKTIADHSHYTGDIRESAWWGHEPELSDSVSAAGGGHAHCGAMIYLGDNWPSEFRNSIYFNNIHGNRINNDILKREGSGFVGHHGKDFLFANDKWYRGINLKYGPDGTVHLIDWYDKNACHRMNPEIWDRSNGRIYRVSYGDVDPKVVDLSEKTDLELAKLHAHDNDWYVRTARRLLQERASGGSLSPEAVNHLIDVLRSDEPATTRLRALWTLSVTKQLSNDQLNELADDKAPAIRSWYVRLAVPEVLRNGMPNEQSQLWRFVRLATDSAPSVRLNVASALQRLPISQRWIIAEMLLSRSEDSDDHNLPLMIWYGVEPLVVSDTTKAIELANKSRIPTVSRFIARRAAAESESLDALIASISNGSPSWQKLVLDEMYKSFEGRVDIPMPKSWKSAYERLSKTDDVQTRDLAENIAVVFGDKRILPRMREVLTDTKADIGRRKMAMEVLTRARDSEAATSYLSAISSPKLRLGAIQALAAYDHDLTPAAFVENFSRFNAVERRAAVSTLTSRVTYANELIDAIEGKLLPRSAIHAYDIRQMQNLRDDLLTRRLSEVWGTIRESTVDKKKRIDHFKTLLSKRNEESNVSNGRVLFNKNCATCHRLFGEGDSIGPDITGSNRGDLDYILENIVDPSAIVSKDYRMSRFELDNGRVVTGLVERETDSAYTVRTATDSVLIAKSSVDDKTTSELSLMPEGQLDQLSDDEVCDLIAYLASPSQVSLPKVVPQLGEDGKVAGALEGESIKLLSKSGGQTQAQGMAGFRNDRWSGDKQLWWTGQPLGATLQMEIVVPKAGDYRVEVVLTRAIDYGVVQFEIDDKPVGGKIDCFIPSGVDNTGVLTLAPRLNLDEGAHRLGARLIAKHPKSTGTMFGLDYVRLVPLD